MEKRILTGLAALTLLDIAASTAQAQVHSWSGPYIGLHAGHRWADADFSSGPYTLNNPVDLDPPVAARAETYNLDSGLVGVHSGYNLLIQPQVLIGVESDTSFAAGHDSRTRTITIDGAAYNLVSKADLNWQGTLRARLGVVQGPWLMFAAGGLAFTEFKWGERFSGPGFVPITVSKSDILTGWTVGGGVEFALGRLWSVRGEYLYENFGSTNVPLAAALPAGTQGNIDLEVHKVRFGVSYRLGN